MNDGINPLRMASPGDGLGSMVIYVCDDGVTCPAMILKVHTTGDFNADVDLLVFDPDDGSTKRTAGVSHSFELKRGCWSNAYLIQTSRWDAKSE